MVAIAHVVTALHVVSGTLLIVDRLKGRGVAATTSDLSPHLPSGLGDLLRCCGLMWRADYTMA